ncbi:MAG: hypothetical protein WD004_04815 [Actinomycetota bacterium]
MWPFRRRRLPSDLEATYAAFLSAIESVEKAKAAVVAAVPSARYPGVPLGDALGSYDRFLAEADTRMAPWFDERLAGIWEGCDAGIVEARRVGDRLREQPSELGFESLLETVQELLDPLEPFELAEERFRSLRE